MFFNYNLRKHFDKRENKNIMIITFILGSVLGAALFNYNILKQGLITWVLLFAAIEVIIYTIKPEFFKRGHAFLKRKLVVLIFGNVLTGMLLFVITVVTMESDGQELTLLAFLIIFIFGGAWLFSLWNKFDDKRYAQENEHNPCQKMYVTQPYGSWYGKNPNRLSYAQVMASYKVKIRNCYLGVIVSLILAITLNSLDVNSISDFDLKVWAITLIVISVLLGVITTLEVMRLEEHQCYKVKPKLKTFVLAIIRAFVCCLISIVTSLTAFGIIGGLFGIIG